MPTSQIEIARDHRNRLEELLGADTLASRDRKSIDAALRKNSDFKFFTKELRAVTKTADDGSQQMYLEAPASSTVIDRMGDRMSLSCQQKMEQQAKRLTIWLNHEYQVPEDIFGTCEESYLQSAQDDEQGACTDLWIRVRVDQENERAVKAWKHVKNNTRLGFSIGGQILDYDFAESPDGETIIFTITDIDLYEISLVGIPANQRAIVEDVAKGLRKKLGKASSAEQIRAQKDAIVRRHVGADDGAPVNVNDDGELVVDESSQESTEQTKGETDGQRSDTAAGGDTGGSSDPGEPEPAATDGAALGATLGISAAAIARAWLAKNPDAELFPLDVRDQLIEKLLDGTVLKSGRAISNANAEKIQAAIKSISDSVDHGVCSEASKSLDNATSSLNEVLNNGQEDNGDNSEKAATTRLATMQRDLEAAQAKLATLNATIAERETEKLLLAEIIAIRQATPLGRRSKAYAGGSSGSESTDPDYRRQPVAVKQAALASKMSGVSADPRIRSIR